MQPQACDYSEYHQNSRHLNFRQVQDVKDQANQLHGINKYIQRPRPNGLMRREKRSVQPDAAVVGSQLVKLAYRPGRSIKSACMSSSYAPKNMQKTYSKNPGHHRDATATVESHLMLDSKFTKTPAGLISFLPTTAQKRPFSSASQTRHGTSSNQTSHLKMSAAAGQRSKSRHSRQLFQGLKYGQAASMSCSLKQSQALHNYRNTITDFNGLTLLERQYNFRDYTPNEGSQEQLKDASRNYVAVTEPAEVDYQCSANQIRIEGSKNNRVMFPSQFASAKSGLMGFEERSVGVRHGGGVRALRGHSKSEVGQHREPLPSGSSWHTRMFSKTKVYLNDADNCTDGITLPISYFDLMPKKEIEAMLELYEMRRKKNNDAPSSTGLLVSVNTIPTHFNIDSNNLHKHLKNDLIDQLANQDQRCEGEPNSALKRWTALVHVSKIDFSRSSDDDTATLPDWVFPSLQIQTGEPVVVSLDRQLTNLQSTLNDTYLLKQIQLEPLQPNYLEMGMQDKRNQESDKSNKDETRDAEQLHCNDSHEAAKQGIQQALKGYRILRPDKVLRFFTNNKTYEFQIRGLNDGTQGVYVNSQNHKLEIVLIMNDLLATTPGKNASFARGNSLSNKTKRGSNRPEKQQSAGIDLDLILQERGLDIFYMDEVLNESRGLNQSPLQRHEERKETAETAKPAVGTREDVESSHRCEIQVGPEVTLKTVAKTGAKLKNMLHDIDSSDQSGRDPASPPSPQAKSNEDLRLKLLQSQLQSQPSSTPRVRENHSDDGNSPSRPSRGGKGIAKTQANTLGDLGKSPHQPSDKGPQSSGSPSPKIESPGSMKGPKNFADALHLQYEQNGKDQALDGHVLVADQDNSTHRTKSYDLHQPDAQKESSSIAKAMQHQAVVQRTKPPDSFAELLRKKEKSRHEHNKLNDQILDQNNLRSPTKQKQKLETLGGRSILSDGPSYNGIVLRQLAAARGSSTGGAHGLGEFEGLLLKQQFREKFENIDQAQLRTESALAAENDDEKCELSASSQGQAALLETAMLPALPADGEAEALGDDAPGRGGASPHRQRAHRASLAMPPTAAEVRQPDTKAHLATGAPFVKDNICLKVNNMEVFDGLQQPAHTKAPVEKHNTGLGTSFQTLGDVLNSAAFGRRKASEGSVTDFLTQTISKEKEAAKRVAPSGAVVSRTAAVGRSHESERQFQTIVRHPTDFASTPNGDFSVFVVPKDFRIKAVKKVGAAKTPTPLRPAATAEQPTKGEEMEALRASAELEGCGVALDESVMRKWATGSRGLHGQPFLRAQQQKSQQSGTLHTYAHNEASKKIETSLFTCGGMRPLFSPTLAIVEPQAKKPEGSMQLAPTVYSAVAPEAEFTPKEEKMFEDLHKMILQEQYSRSQESVLGHPNLSNRIYSQAKQAAAGYNRDIEAFGPGGEEGTQDLIKAAGDESEVPSLRPSPSLKTHQRTQRRLDEAGPAPNDKGSHVVSDRSGITQKARPSPGSPGGAEIEGDQARSGLPTPMPGGKHGAEMELKAEVTVKTKNADLHALASAPATQPSARSKSSGMGQVVFSKKHVHGSPKRGTIPHTPDQRQGMIAGGSPTTEKGSATPVRQATRAGDARYRSPDRPQGFNQMSFQLQMGGSGHNWDGLVTTQKLVKKTSTKTRIDVPNADLSSALKQSEPVSPQTQLLPPSRPSEKKGLGDERVDDASQDENGDGHPKLTGAAALASAKYKIELKPANWRQITQTIREKAKRYRRAGAPPSNWESIKANFAKLQGGQTSETQNYSAYGSNLEPSRKTAAVRPGLQNTTRSTRQRARGLKTLCAGEISEYNHHSASIPQGCKGVGKTRHTRARSKQSSSCQASGRDSMANLNQGFSFVSPAVPVSGVRIALMRAYPHSLFRNELPEGFSPGGRDYEKHDLLRLNEQDVVPRDYGLWGQQGAPPQDSRNLQDSNNQQAADTRGASASRAGELETHLGPAQPRWSGHSRAGNAEAPANILSNQTLGLAYQMGAESDGRSQ